LSNTKSCPLDKSEIIYQSGVNDMVHGGEPLPDSEADPPQCDDVGEEGVPHDVPAHHSTSFVLKIGKK
jgi:hypothetical protein